MSEDYALPAFIVGGIVFLGAWAYAALTYGFFLGIGLGWIPAMMIGVIAGLLWPFVILGVFAVALIIYSGGM